MDAMPDRALIPVKAELKTLRVFLTHSATRVVGIDFGDNIAAIVVPVFKTVWNGVFGEGVEKFGEYQGLLPSVQPLRHQVMIATS